MTESIWLSTSEALALLAYLFPVRGLDSTDPQVRKSRLYLTACARHVWNFLPWAYRALVEIAEQLADGEAVEVGLRRAAYEAAEGLVHRRGDLTAVAEAERLLTAAGLTPSGVRPSPAFESAPKLWAGLAHLIYAPYCHETPTYSRIPPTLHSADLIRELWGSPFSPREFDPTCRTNTVLTLARAMYGSRDFSAMPLLADALMDAGCVDESVLTHCRERNPGSHARLLGARPDPQSIVTGHSGTAPHVSLEAVLFTARPAVTYLIDGYNLMHAAGLVRRQRTARGLEQAREKFLDWLAENTANRGEVIRVVFDARSAPTPSAEYSHRGIRVCFAFGQTADDRIEDMIRTAAQPRLLAVVSNDSRVREDARRHGCRVLSCESFIDWLLETNPGRLQQPATEKPDADASPAEMAAWLAAFKEQTKHRR